MALKITLTRSDPLQMAVDAVVIGIPEGATGRMAVLRALKKAVGPMVAKLLKRHEFTGKRDQLVTIPTAGALKAGQVIVVGLGKPEALTVSVVRRMAAVACRRAAGARAVSMAIVMPTGADGALLGGAPRAVAEGVVLGAYRFERYKSDDKKAKFPLGKVSLVIDDKVTAELRGEVALGQRVGEAICLARDLINEPPNELHPAAFADYAKQMCKDRGLTCKVLDDGAIRKKGMQLLTAVGQGSAHGPRLVHMTYRPKGKRDVPRLVFVGKGLTFDTGGICLKPPQGMEDMKGDMGGAANVVALMAAVAAVEPDAEVHGIIACAENMPDGKSYRPGDIFGSYDGKTVEIINTDAEGRLALADALAYARELEPDLLLDNATLTGACVVALGPTVSGYYANRDELSVALRQAAATAGEQMWQLPLVEDLREMLKSDWADIKHVGERWGGSITAALFLGEFVGECPWIHVDIAGPSMASKARDIYSKGGTGHGVLTFLQLIEDRIAAGSGEPPAEPDDAA